MDAGRRASGGSAEEELRLGAAASAAAVVDDEGEAGEAGGQQRNRRPTWHVRATANLKVEDPSLLRGMPLARGLRGFASVLSSRPATAQYYKLSAPVERIDSFISHNWNTPRWRKFLVLIFHFNIRFASLVSFGIALTACVLTALGVLPSVNGSFVNEELPRGIFCLPLGLAAFLLSLCFGHELDWLSPSGRRCGRRHVLFLDKTCVHQTSEERKRAGIQCLAAFLARSNAFVMVYSDVYMQRLWTVYECASWLLLHPGEPIYVRPVLYPVLVLCGLVCGAAWDIYYAAMHAAAFTGFAEAFMLLSIPIFSIGARTMSKVADDLDAIQARIDKFSLADAKCASDDDRLVVQANIVAFMKLANMSRSEDSDEQVFEAFEALVKREVPRLMLSSNSRSGGPYLLIICPMFPRIYGILDSLAGYYLCAEFTARYIVLLSLLNAWFAFLMWPATVALLACLARCPRLRTPPACLGIGVLTFFLVAGSWTLGEAAIAEAEGSDIWLLLVLSFFGFSLVATWKLYRPLGLSTH